MTPWIRPVLRNELPNGAEVNPLVEFLPGSLERIAPEKLDGLRESLSGVELIVSNEAVCNAWAEADAKRITITRAMLDCLYCLALAYLAFKREIERQERAGVKRVVVRENTPELETGFAAFRAATIALGSGGLVDWAGVPPPSTAQADRSLVAQASDLALGAAAFVLHHEMAHVQLGHKNSGRGNQWSLEMEKEADSRAIGWIFDEVPDDARTAFKRSAAVVIATTLMTAVETERYRRGASPVKDRTHPMPYDRMDKALRHEKIWGPDYVRNSAVSFAVAALMAHVRIAGVVLPAEEYPDYTSAYEGILDALSVALAPRK